MKTCKYESHTRFAGVVLPHAEMLFKMKMEASLWLKVTLLLQLQDGLCTSQRLRMRRGSTAQWLAYLLLIPAAPGLIPSGPKKNFRGKIVDDAEVNQWRWLEERGQWHEKVCQNHQVKVNQNNQKD